jgi:hypothetical protein
VFILAENNRTPQRVEQIIELLRTTTQPVTLIATGKSMLPTIKDGDKLTIAPYSFKERLCENAIIVFERRHRLVCHRCLFSLGWGSRQYIYEKGDNNFLGRHISAGRIIGRLISINDNNTIPPAPMRLSPFTLLMRRITDGIYRLFKPVNR